jgi:hypothetical protein
MKYILHIILFTILTSNVTAQQHAWLDTNDVRLRVYSDGIIGRREGSAATLWLGQFVPKADQTSSLFACGIWIAGTNPSGEVRAATQIYSVSNDMRPGPLTVGSATTGQEISGMYDHAWSVRAADVVQHHAWAQCVADPFCDEAASFPGYTIPSDFSTWPAHGDELLGLATHLAPFVDLDGNGIYTPASGEYPCVPGDQALYIIFNDQGEGEYVFSQGPRMGLEVHMIPFSYASDDKAIDQTIFIHYRIINRSDLTYENVRIGVFADIDVGCSNDDFIGSDVARNLMFGYNWSDIDQSCLGSIGYGADPPAYGITLLKGPLLNATGADGPVQLSLPSYNGTGFGDGVADNERSGMTGMIYFNREGHQFMTDPSNVVHVNNYLQSTWKNGVHMTYGGNGYSDDPAAVIANFMYPWDTDTLGVGTAGIPMPDWREVNPTPAMPDRRGVMSSGPFTLGPGMEQDVLYAHVYARASGGGAVASVHALKDRVDSVRAFAQNIPGIMAPGSPCEGLALDVSRISGTEEPLLLRPNPTRDLLVLDGRHEGIAAAHVIDGLGKVVSSQAINSYPVEIDVRHLSPGVYHLRLEARDSIRYGRFVKE